MQKTLNYQINSFKNPFEEINANKIDDEGILNLWCTPFNNQLIKHIDEEKFRTQKIPIILQGFRGSGKTMILRYFSYSVQKKRAKINGKSIYEQIVKEKSVGFYFVCEESFIKTFRQIFSHFNDAWVSIFEHYFELRFCKQLLIMLNDLFQEQAELEEIFFSEFQNIYNYYSTFKGIKHIDHFLKVIIDELAYIDNYKNDYIFSGNDFKPNHLFDLYSLSSKIIEAAKSIDGLSDITYLLLVDEFENLPEELQKFFNTAIKFSKDAISLRIGRRSEGKVSTATINNSEYLRENHDYFLAKIDVTDNLSYKKYFSEIARKRLSQNTFFNNCEEISSILGDSENLDQESLELCKGKKKHIEYILSARKDLDTENLERVVSIISNPDNPIAESLNSLWIVRNKKDNPIISAEKAAKAMNDYFNGVKNTESNKYRLDYSDKYRYSIVCLLATIYKKNKMYYSFNTITYLSNGNTRTFINICRLIISNAMFYERDSFLETAVVSKKVQNQAICEFANSEFNSICSIISSGNYIRNLILNIGNVFAEYHRDKLVRYPETNQFVFDKLELSKEVGSVIDIAESWSMIIRKEKTQRVSLSIDKKGDIYYINKAFCPIFGISYRTRGGFNVEFKAEELEKMITSLGTINKLSKSKSQKMNKTSNVPQNNNQLSLFDFGDNIDE